MKKIFYLFLILLAPAIAVHLMGFGPGQGGGNGSDGQQAFKSAGSPLNMVWEEVGPNNLGTICRSIVVTGNKQAYAGSVGGGLWNTTDGGFTWTQNRGVDANLAVTSVAVDGTNIYAGTGDTYFYIPAEDAYPGWQYPNFTTVKNGFHQYAGTPGEGVFVSTDGGATWTHNNGTWGSGSTPYNDKFMSIHKVAAQGGKVFVACLEGLFWSTNSLGAVTQSNGTGNFMNNPVLDVEFGSGNYVFAATADSVYISSDGGVNFGAGINAKLPNTNAAPHQNIGGFRIEIAVSPSNPSTLYVTGCSFVNGNCNGVWKSTDNGGSWVRKAPAETAGSSAFAPFQNNGRYAMALAVDPVDPDAFLIGGEALYSFDEVNGLITTATHFSAPGFILDYVPTPIHCIAYDPTNSDIHFIGSDQEIVRSTDAGDTYTPKSKGFNCGHIYSISAAPNYKVIASERIHGVSYKNNAATSIGYQEFDVRNSAVGHVEFSLVNPDFIIAQGNDHGLIRSLTNGTTWEQFYGPSDSTHPCVGTDSLYIDRADATSAGGGLYDDAGAPFVPWCFDELIPSASLGDEQLIQASPSYIFMCSGNFVWMVTSPFGDIDSIPRWTRVSPDLAKSSNNPKEYLTAIAVSGDNSHTVYVGTNYGKIFRIANAHQPASLDACDPAFFARVDDPSMPSRWITSFAFDPNDQDNIVVTYGGFETGDAEMIYLTNNGLDAAGNVTWRGIDDTGTGPVPIYTAAFHPDAGIGALLIGREDGVFSTTDDWTVGTSSITWNSENAAPMNSVPVYDIQIRPYYMNISGNNYSYAPDHMVFLATHGRGVFRSSTLIARDDFVSTPGLDMTMFPNPVRAISTIEISLPVASNVKVEVYSLSGVKVASLTDQTFSAGKQQVMFDATGLNAGIYLVKAMVKNSKGEFTKTMKSVVVK